MIRRGEGSLLTALTSKAVEVFHLRLDPAKASPLSGLLNTSFISDPVAEEALRLSFILPDEALYGELTRSLIDDPDFAGLAPRSGDLDPMLLHPRGGMRMGVDAFIPSLFGAALQQ